MEASILRQYQEYSRYLRPFRSITFTDREMLTTMLMHVEPDDVASVTQLLGDRRGVIRITFKTNIGVQRLEEMVRTRQLLIKGIPLGLVEESGHYYTVTLDNVPSFISEDQVEEAMAQFGTIAGILRDHVEFRGKKIETEKRKILYTTFTVQAVLPKELEICGISVFVRSRSSPSNDDELGGRTRPSMESLHRRDLDSPTSTTDSPRDKKGHRKTSSDNGEGKGKKVMRANALNLLNNELDSKD